MKNRAAAKIPLLNSFLTLIALGLVLMGCNTGSGGGSSGFGLNGGPISGSFSATSTSAQIYTFNVVADTAYTISTVTTAGDIALMVYNGNPVNNNIIGWSFSNLATTPYDNISFISSFTGTISVVIAPMATTASYTLQAFDGNVPIGGSKTASTYNDTIYYSFEAVGGTAYQVRLTPQTGNADIASVNAKLTASVGSSALTGTAMDTVSFLAPATQRYYIQTNATSTNTTFDMQVATTTVDPDLRAVVTSAVSDGVSSVTVNYTIYNQGINASSAFSVTGWSDATSAPTIGSSGPATATHTSLAAGASLSGSFVMTNAADTGTAYVIVDTANAVLEANESNNVSAGKSWKKPLLAPQSFNFEDGLMPTAMTMSANANWSIDSTTGATSSKSMKAGTITHSQSSCVSMSAANAASISFDYAVSSESWDDLKFYIDGVESRTWSGTVLWTNTGPITVSTIAHEYKWCYIKDSSITSGSDSAWIDNIVVAPASVDLQTVINTVFSSGSTVTITYTASNTGNTASGPFNVDIWSNSASIPTIGMAGESSTSFTSLAAGASASRTVTINNANANGTAYALIDTQNSVLESDEANNISVGQAWVAPPSVAVPASFNFENGILPAEMAMSGNSPWAIAASGAGASAYSLKAGTITHSQTSCVAINATGSSSASFDYSVSSESGYDFLNFYIDGVLKGSWSGTVAWTSSGAITAATTGTHQYKWCYSKDSSVSSGSDTAWIDNIAIN